MNTTDFGKSTPEKTTGRAFLLFGDTPQICQSRRPPSSFFLLMAIAFLFFIYGCATAPRSGQQDFDSVYDPEYIGPGQWAAGPSHPFVPIDHFEADRAGRFWVGVSQGVGYQGEWVIIENPSDKKVTFQPDRR